MGDRITFYMLSAKGAPPRSVTAPKALVAAIALFSLAILAVLSVGIYDYRQLKAEALQTRRLRSQLTLKDDELALQHKQIQNFAREINALKSRLLTLGEFERQIRVVAGLPVDDRKNGLMGIGGPLPEDLSATAALSLKHAGLVREMHDRMDGLEMASRDRAAGFEGLMRALESRKNLLACKPSIRPAEGIVSSGFGSRECPFTGLPEFHSGLDIANHKGTPIVATADGTVTFVGDKGPLGLTIVVNHGHGIVTRYAHIDKALKKQGDAVKRGDVVAQMGSSGRSTGPHVHYEVRINGAPVNPGDHILN
jgi:murein DD-endopeptidase MepM/ murein hydrolase activator NlpD